MERYTLLCTDEQIRKAFELGAPIERHTGVTTAAAPEGYYLEVDTLVKIPTTEQMIGWLEEQGFNVFAEAQPYKGDRLWIGKVYNINSPSNYHSYNCLFWRDYYSRKEATLAAIDAALEYLSNNKK